MGLGSLCSIGVELLCTYAKNVLMAMIGVVCVHIGYWVHGGEVRLSAHIIL